MNKPFTYHTASSLTYWDTIKHNIRPSALLANKKNQILTYGINKRDIIHIKAFIAGSCAYSRSNAHCNIRTQ